MKDAHSKTILALLIISFFPVWALLSVDSPTAYEKPIAISTLGPGDLFDPEQAMSHGIPGYVKVQYVSDVPRLTIVSPGEEIRYELAFSLVSHTANFTKTLVVLDPNRGVGVGINGVKLNDYVSYENLTCFVLTLDHPVKVIMVFSVPEDREGFSAHTEKLLGVGVNTAVPVKAGLSGRYILDSLNDLRVDVLLGETQVVERMPWDDGNPGISFSKYWGVASKLDSILRTGKMPHLSEIFVTHSPDWRNGTAYVALTDVSEEATGPILALFSDSVRENIRFIHAPAPLPILNEWMLYFEDVVHELEDKGVNWTELSIYDDGRILVGLEEIDAETIAIFNEVLRRVPPGIFVLYETGPSTEVSPK